jgi:uncharacterized protein
MTKDDIRRLSRDFGLPTWDKPAIACLTSRFPYGVEINLERLGKIAACEQALKDLGFREFRVRYHEQLVRIEAAAAEIDRLLDREVREQIVARFKEIGFTYVSLDLEGYRTGSMNEAIKKTG